MGRPKKPVQQMNFSPAVRRNLLRRLQKGPVEVMGMGTFTLVDIPAKRLYHNFSKKVRVLPAYRKVKFTQSKELKAVL